MSKLGTPAPQKNDSEMVHCGPLKQNGGNTHKQAYGQACRWRLPSTHQVWKFHHQQRVCQIEIHLFEN